MLLQNTYFSQNDILWFIKLLEILHYVHVVIINVMKEKNCGECSVKLFAENCCAELQSNR